MKARVPTQTYLEQEIEKAKTQTRLETIKACMIAFVASLNDVGLADSTMDKILKKNRSYTESILRKTVTWQEIADNLKEERNITFEWIGGENQ